MLAWYRIDSVEALKGRLPAMRDQVRTDPTYFAKIYQHAFDFARAEGQRSLRKSVLHTLHVR
jgi:DCN1-like protein 1/2